MSATTWSDLLPLGIGKPKHAEAFARSASVAITIFRPDQGGRSLGELAWHLAEGDAYMSFGIENRGFART